jgi:TM2 domain-containing membrane protein YozV
MDYYMAAGAEQRGPFAKEHLLGQGLRPETLVWTDGMAQWQRADSVADLAWLFGPPMQTAPSFAARSVTDTKLAAGLCGIFLGALGIHKFVLGMTNAGITMLLITVLTCGFGGVVMHVFGIIEGIIYLTKSDQEFYQTYMVQKKAWF